MARRLVYIAAPIWLGSSRPRRREVLRGSVNSDRVRRGTQWTLRHGECTSRHPRKGSCKRRYRLPGLAEFLGWWLVARCARSQCFARLPCVLNAHSARVHASLVLCKCRVWALLLVLRTSTRLEDS